MQLCVFRAWVLEKLHNIQDRGCCCWWWWCCCCCCKPQSCTNIFILFIESSSGPPRFPLNPVTSHQRNETYPRSHLLLLQPLPQTLGSQPMVIVITVIQHQQACHLERRTDTLKGDSPNMHFLRLNLKVKFVLFNVCLAIEKSLKTLKTWCKKRLSTLLFKFIIFS